LSLDKYIYNETRYTMLVHSQPEAARQLLALAQEEVNKRWKLYEYLAAMPGNGKVQEAIAQEVKNA
jgi:pyruvate-ferredoxin/flavodoxin oxidoreductase